MLNHQGNSLKKNYISLRYCNLFTKQFMKILFRITVRVNLYQIILQLKVYKKYILYYKILWENILRFECTDQYLVVIWTLKF